MCEQLGVEPDPDKIPPEEQDFPLEVQAAIQTFGKLGDKVVVDLGYMGKDYTALPLYLKLLKFEDEDIFLETLLRLDERQIKNSAAAMKRAREQAARKQ